MMDRRLELHAKLLTVCDNVYFQPPSNVKMRYPCIVYSPSSEDRNHANNNTYHINDAYQITIIDPNPDSIIRQSLRVLPLISFNRHASTEGLNHFYYTLYF